jgi:hypothetical protein
MSSSSYGEAPRAAERVDRRLSGRRMIGRMPNDVLTLRQLNRATLARQMLLSRSAADATDVVRHLVAMQAQLPRPPFIGLWSRVDGFRRDDVVKALTGKRLVRGTSLRGTLHLMTAEDFARFRGPLQAALDRGVKMVAKRADAAAIAAALEAGREFFAKPYPFDAFREHLEASHAGKDIRAMAYACRMLVPLLQVPDGSAWGFPAQAGFITAEAWLGPRRATASGTAEDLVLRYLAAYGPSTVADAQAWSGIPSLRPVFTALRPRLAVFRAEKGGELFDLPDAPRPAADTPAPVRFLPDWDNVIVGRADSRILDAPHRAAVFQPGLRILATVLVDGHVAGTWSLDRRRSAAVVRVSLFAKAPARVRKEIEREADGVARFVEPAATAYQIEFA